MILVLVLIRAATAAPGNCHFLLFYYLQEVQDIFFPLTYVILLLLLLDASSMADFTRKGSVGALLG